MALFLKKSGKMKLPEWVDYVKLGPHKELAPVNDDWYYMRAASVARHLFITSPVGMAHLRRAYGGKKRNGNARSHNCPSSGAVMRKILQNLETLKMVEKDPNSGGRRLTETGRRDLNRIAGQVKTRNKSKKDKAGRKATVVTASQ